MEHIFIIDHKHIKIERLSEWTNTNCSFAFIVRYILTVFDDGSIHKEEIVDDEVKEYTAYGRSYWT